MIEISVDLVMKHEKMGSLQLEMEHIALQIPKGVSSPAESVMLFFAPIFFSKGPICIFFLSTIFPAAFEKCGKLHALVLL